MESLACFRQELFLMIFSRAGIRTELSRESASVEAIPRNWGTVVARSGSSRAAVSRAMIVFPLPRRLRWRRRKAGGGWRVKECGAGGATALSRGVGSPDRGWRMV